jgi:hypothetical protein
VCIVAFDSSHLLRRFHDFDEVDVCICGGRTILGAGAHMHEFGHLIVHAMVLVVKTSTTCERS